MTTSPLHRNDTEGADDKGRLHGAHAVQRLLNSIPAGPDWNDGHPVNAWDAADDAVATADQETKDAALRRLLALHIFDLKSEHPQVAMRNIRVGDVVQMAGIACRVVDKDGDGKNGHTVGITTRTVNDVEQTFRYSGDMHVTLLGRVSDVHANQLFQEIVNELSLARHADPEVSAYVRGLSKAFCMLTGESREVLDEQVYEATQDARQARHDEWLDSAEREERF